MLLRAFRNGRRLVLRETPVPPALMAALDRQFGLATARRDADAAGRRLWPCSRTTAWRHVKTTMEKAGIGGAQASPEGLRHGFGNGETDREHQRVLADRFARWSDSFAAPPATPSAPPPAPASPRPQNRGPRAPGKASRRLPKR